MKLETLLTAAFLASTATAVGPSGPNVPPRLKGQREKMASWRFPNPFDSPHHSKFTPRCEVQRTFEVDEYLLDDLGEKEPLGLISYRDALKQVFATREYPGSWDGVDPHGYDRNLLAMRYDLVPLAVREWIEDQERTDGKGKGLYAVYPAPMPGTRVMTTVKVPESPVPEEWRSRDENRVAIFAPGAVYEILPLWVAEGSGCEESFTDLSKYSANLVDGGVVAYPVHYTWPKRGQGMRNIEFQVKAQVLQLNEGENAPGTAEIGETEKVEETKSEETKSAEKEEL